MTTSTACRGALHRRVQVSVAIDNTPGSLARISGLLAGKGINVTALAAWGGRDHGVLRLITSDSKSAARVLRAAGFAVTEQPVLELTLPNRPGVVMDVARRLASARVNVDYFYGADAEDSGVMIFRVDDLTRAEGALRTSRFVGKGVSRKQGRAPRKA